MTAARIPLRGDESDLFRRYRDQLLRVVRRRVVAPDDVIEDACAFAWAQLLDHQPDRATAFAWLKQVAVREAWRICEREGRDSSFDLLGIDDDARIGPNDTDRAVEVRAALEVLASLPKRQRLNLALLIAGYSYDEIAAMTHASYTSDNKRLARARRTIRRQQR